MRFIQSCGCTFVAVDNLYREYGKNKMVGDIYRDRPSFAPAKQPHMWENYDIKASFVERLEIPFCVV